MPVLSTFSIILSGIWQLDLPFCAMTAMKMMETHIINGINVINMVKLDSEIQARLAQIWQLSASVFLWFASQKMGFQSVRSRRSTGSFWHGTWQCFGLPWPCTSSQCAYPQTSPNSFSLSRLPHTGWTGHGLISSEPDSASTRLSCTILPRCFHDLSAEPCRPCFACWLWQWWPSRTVRHCKTQYAQQWVAVPFTALDTAVACPPRVGQLHGRPQLHAWHAHVIHILQRKSGFSLRSAVQCWSVLRGELKNSALHVRATFRGRNVVHEGHLFDRFIFKSQQITHWICRSWTSCRGFACWNCPSETVIATCTETGPKAWRNISWHSLTMLDIEWPIWYNSCFRRLDFLFNLLQPPISHGTSREPVCSTDSASCNTLWDTALGYLWNGHNTFRTGSQWNVYSISQDQSKQAWNTMSDPFCSDVHLNSRPELSAHLQFQCRAGCSLWSYWRQAYIVQEIRSLTKAKLWMDP